MNIDIHAIHFTSDDELKQFISKRLGKLELFFDRIIATDVFLKVENSSDKTNKIVEVRLQVPNETLIVKKSAKSFEEGIDQSADSLERQLLKHKQKLRN
jgi:putative sigma-54 modulation protein